RARRRPRQTPLRQARGLEAPPGGSRATACSATWVIGTSPAPSNVEAPASVGARPADGAGVRRGVVPLRCRRTPASTARRSPTIAGDVRTLGQPARRSPTIAGDVTMDASLSGYTEDDDGTAAGSTSLRGGERIRP